MELGVPWLWWCPVHVWNRNSLSACPDGAEVAPSPDGAEVAHASERSLQCRSVVRPQHKASYFFLVCFLKISICSLRKFASCSATSGVTKTSTSISLTTESRETVSFTEPSCPSSLSDQIWRRGIAARSLYRAK